MIQESIPKFDLPVDFIVDDNITGAILNLYGKFPCKIKAAIFALCCGGTIRATINLKEYTISQQEFIVLIPGSFIQIHEVSDDARVCFAGFSSQFLTHVHFWKNMAEHFMALLNNPVIQLPGGVPSIYQDAFSLLTRAGGTEEIILTPDIMKSVMDIFLQSISRMYTKSTLRKSQSPSRDYEILSEFMQLAFENYMTEHKITFYARAAGLTLSHFCSSISKASGMTAQEIIMRLIIMDAKAQLKGSDMRVNKIAASLGFQNPTTFNRYFREYVGMTPEEYRNS